MILEYTDLFDNQKRKRVKSTITTDHSLSSYGCPVILLNDGNPLDYSSWVLLGYRVIKATKAERGLLKNWLKLLNISL